MAFKDDLNELMGNDKVTEKVEKKPTEPTAETTTESVETTETEVEPKSEATTQTDQEAAPVETIEDVKQRTLESLEDEIKNLRKENATRRHEKKALAEKATELFQVEKDKMEAEVKRLQKVADEYEAKKKQSEEVNLTVEEKLTTKENALKDSAKMITKLERAYEETKKKLDTLNAEKEEEQQIRAAAIEKKLELAIADIPEDRQPIARAIVNGHEDAQEGLLALLHAKSQNMFGERIVQVAHAVPKEDNTTKTETSTNKTAKQKIKSGLASGLRDLRPGQKLV